MAKTEKLSYHNAKKYAHDLWLNCENETDTRLKLSNRMMGLVLMMGLETGARISDLLKMKYSDIETHVLDFNAKIQEPLSEDELRRTVLTSVAKKINQNP